MKLLMYFGQAYEYLIKKFADLTNKKAGEFYTPRSVVALMVRILAPKAGETIYDPACGTGGMLLEALHHVKEHGGDENLMLGKLYGQEKNLTTSSIARMNLFLHGAEDFHIERGDTLRLPAFYSGDSLITAALLRASRPPGKSRSTSKSFTTAFANRRDLAICRLPLSASSTMQKR